VVAAAPLAPAFRAEPLWHAGVTLDHAPRELPRRADVVVVGGGYCGLAAGAELGRRGRDAIVLEAAELGHGASTRNGGMVLAELKRGVRFLTRRYGPLGRRLVESTYEAFSLVEELVGHDGIECDYARTGALVLAHDRRALGRLRHLERECVDDLDEPARLVDRDSLREELGSDRYLGGLLLERAGRVQPARYYGGLLGRARAAGASVHAHTRATGIVPSGTGFRVDTSRGAIDCADVLVATNAYADGLVPGVRRRVLPVGSFIIATVPLTADVASAVIPRGRMCYDTKNFLFYWRLSPDRRLVFGGRTSFVPTTVAKARDVLYRELVRVYPQVDGVPLEFAWGGEVALTVDRLPHFGRLDGVAFATGCNGAGVALATWFGFRAAAWLCGEEPAPPFAEIPFRRVPFHAFRAAWLPAIGAWFRLCDWV
jgi:glycine/D-amino acid oxidase-like deaminating enzyme